MKGAGLPLLRERFGLTSITSPKRILDQVMIPTFLDYDIILFDLLAASGRYGLPIEYVHLHRQAGFFEGFLQATDDP